MKIITKTFDQLTTTELHDLLQLRSEVFVVEQDCVYQDIDGKDMKALHVLGYEQEALVAYTRCFAPGDYFEEAAIGRIVVKEDKRSFGYGHMIVDASEESIKDHYGRTDIKLSAQTYLEKFYNSHGYVAKGPTYLEDGIPHIAMVKTV